MKETKIGAFTTIALVLLVSVFQFGKSQQFDVTGGMGIATFWLGFLALIIGMFLTIIPATRKYGRGVLIGGGVLLLIGVSFCSGGFGLIK